MNPLDAWYAQILYTSNLKTGKQNGRVKTAQAMPQRNSRERRLCGCHSDIPDRRFWADWSRSRG